MKPLQIQVLRSGYVVGKKQLQTVVALEAELIQRRARNARVVPGKDASYRKVAAAMRVLQRMASLRASLEIFKASRSQRVIAVLPNNALVPTRNGEAPLLAAQRDR